jgi:hypothetical protein
MENYQKIEKIGEGEWFSAVVYIRCQGPKKVKN